MASSTSLPCSKCQLMFSIVTVASSTKIPPAKASPPSVMMFKVSPSADKPTMAVDTHVFRVSARIGLTIGAKTPLAAEKQLVKNFPKEHINKLNHWLILHGRYVCIARKPKCEECGLQSVCKFFDKNSRRKKIE